jgi:hypothetical protein
MEAALFLCIGYKILFYELCAYLIWDIIISIVEVIIYRPDTFISILLSVL